MLNEDIKDEIIKKGRDYGVELFESDIICKELLDINNPLNSHINGEILELTLWLIDSEFKSQESR